MFPRRSVCIPTGTIWRAYDQSSRSNVVIKEANKELHHSSSAMVGNRTYSVIEDVLTELSILEYLSKDKNCPKSMVKFLQSFQR